VRQHRAPYAVPDRPYALHARAAGVIDADEAALVKLHAGIRAEQIPGIGAATDRHHQPLDGKALCALRILVGDIDRRARHRSAGDLGAQANVEAEFLEVSQRFPGELLVGECQEIRQRLQHHHLGAEAPPHAAQLQSDHTPRR